MSGYIYSTASIISGRIGIIIIPHPKPITHNPTTIIFDELCILSISDGPMSINETQMIIYPINITPRFYIFDVNKYITEVVLAYIIVGTAKANPMNSYSYPNDYKWRAKVG